MGCSSSSDPYEPLAFDQKATVWFLGGGPGSPKQVYPFYHTDLLNSWLKITNSNTSQPYS